MKILWLVLIILLCMPCSIAREIITGSFTLENEKPSVSLEIVKESLKIEVRDANGFEDIEYVRVFVINKSREFSDFAVFEEGKDMDAVYYYDLKELDNCEIGVVVSDGENVVSSTISYSREDPAPFITGFVVMNENIKGYFSRLGPYIRGLFDKIFG